VEIIRAKLDRDLRTTNKETGFFSESAGSKRSIAAKNPVSSRPRDREQLIFWNHLKLLKGGPKVFILVARSTQLNQSKPL
jgi:hypothetical protein